MKFEDKAEFFGPPMSQQGQYTFYKGFKFKAAGKLDVILLGEFILVKIWPEEETVAIAEVQLCWFDRIQEGNFSSVKLYFLPEHTAEGRNLNHGQDEVVSLTENMVIRIDDLISLVPETYQWQHGQIGVTLRPTDIMNAENHGPVKEYNPPYSCRMNGGLCMKSLRKHKKALGADSLTSRVIVVNYASYCRFRSALRRFEGNNSAFANALVMALGGFAVPREDTRVLFCKDTFEYPELEGHELLCNHLAPKFPSKRTKKTPQKLQSPMKLETKLPTKSFESKFKEEEEIPRRQSLIKPCHRPLAVGSPAKPKNTPAPVVDLPPRSFKLSAAAMAEQTFLEKLYKFMKSRGTPIDRLPSVGTEKLNLYKFYTIVKKVGGYEAVGLKRLWRRLYLEMGGYCSNNAAATATRKHYERFLLPFEQHMNNQPKQPNKGQQPPTPSPIKQNGSLPANGPELRSRAQPTTPTQRVARKRRRKNRTPVKVEKENVENGQVKHESDKEVEEKQEVKRSVDEIDSKTEHGAVSQASVRIVKEVQKSQAEAAVSPQCEAGGRLEASTTAGPSTSIAQISVRQVTPSKATSQVHVPRPGAHQNLPADILPALRTLSELNISIVAADGSKISTGIDGRSALENLAKRTLPSESESEPKRPKIETKTGAVFDAKTGLLTGGSSKAPVGIQCFKNLGSGFSITPVVAKKPEKRPVPPLISIERTQKETKELISNVNMLMNRPDLKVEVKPAQSPEASVFKPKVEPRQASTPPEVLDLTKKKGISVYPIECSPRKDPPRPNFEQKVPTPRPPFQPFMNPMAQFTPTGLMYRPGLPANYLQMMRMAAMPVNPAMVQLYKDMIQNGALRSPVSDLERLMAMQQSIQKR